jgi:hypothetical protein
MHQRRFLKKGSRSKLLGWTSGEDGVLLMDDVNIYLFVILRKSAFCQHTWSTSHPSLTQHSRPLGTTERRFSQSWHVFDFMRCAISLCRRMDQHVALAAWERTSTHADIYCSTNTLDPLTTEAVGCADVSDYTWHSRRYQSRLKVTILGNVGAHTQKKSIHPFPHSSSWRSTWDNF